METYEEGGPALKWSLLEHITLQIEPLLMHVLGLMHYNRIMHLERCHLTNVNFRQQYYSENILQIGPTYKLHYCKLCKNRVCSKRVSTHTTRYKIPFALLEFFLLP